MKKGESQRFVKINTVTTGSPKATAVLNILNTLIDENKTDKATATCVALASYNLQKWAYEGRLRMAQWSVTIDDLITVAKKYELLVEMYDAPQRIKLNEHSQKLEETEQILFLIEKAILDLREYPRDGDKLSDIMEHVHYGSELQEEISSFIFNKRYKSAVQIIINKFGDRFSKNFERLNDSFEEMNVENQLAYHNTEILLEAYPMLYWNLQGIDSVEEVGVRKANSVSRQFLILKMINSAIEEVKEYPVNGDRYYEILKGITKKRSAEEIMNSVRVSRAIYYKNRKQAIVLLSYLLWGYSTREIIASLT